MPYSVRSIPLGLTLLMASLFQAGQGAMANADETVLVAQLVPDSTLGTESSEMSPIDGQTSQVDGGAIRGSTLFHSFQQFSVETGNGVYFSNPLGVDNILTRVTGNLRSDIDGTLGVLGNANLFLINPNGVLFGPNAQLDIRGSLMVSTADYVVLSDGYKFSATNPTTLPLLTLSIDPGLQYGAQPLGDIENAGNLAVDAGQSLHFLGDTVTHSGSLTAPGGQVEAFGNRVAILETAQIDVSEPSTFGNGGQVNIRADGAASFSGDIQAQSGDAGGDGGSVMISGGQSLLFRGAVNVSAPNGTSGTLRLDSENMTIARGSGNGHDPTVETSRIYESALEQLPGDTNVIVQAADQIVVEPLVGNGLDFAPGTGEIRLIADADQNGVGGFEMERSGNLLDAANRNISISGASLNIGKIQTSGGDIELEASNGNIRTGELRSSNRGQGGDVILTATGNITTGEIIAHTRRVVENAGNVELTANGHINTGEISAIAFTGGEGGDVTLNANGGDIGTREILTWSGGRAIGNGGDVTLNASGGNINTHQILTLSSGGESGDGGNIELEANGDINTRNLLSYTYSSLGGNAGRGGDITLEANGAINTGNISTYGAGGGDILLSSETTPLEIENRQFDSSIYYGQGEGGDIYLEAPSVILRNTHLTTTAAGASNADDIRNAGNIRIEVSDHILLEESRLLTSLGTGATGVGGDIEISSPQLDLREFSWIDTATFGTGNAGNVLIDVDTVSLDNSSIFSITGGLGDAGDVDITADDIVLSNRSTISTAVNERATGNGGNINVRARTLTLTGGSQLQVLTNGLGDAGDMQLVMSDSIHISGVEVDPNLTSSGTSSTALRESVTVSDPSTLAESEPNDTIDLAQPIDGSFALDRPDNTNTNVAASTRVPYVAIAGDASDDTPDYYSFEVTAGSRVSFDIDTGVAQGSNQSIVLLDNQGNRLASNEGANTRLGAGGSISRNDPYLSYTFSVPGTYFLKVETATPYELQVSLEAPNVLSGEGRSGFFATTQGTGAAGSISLDTPQLTIENNAAISASTLGAGPGGDIIVNATDQLTARNRSGITVDSQGTGVAGDIEIEAGAIYLDDEAFISAATNSSTGGNISLEIQDVLLLRHGSGLSTTAGTAQAGGDGGNIAIDIADGFLLAVPNENSDISANAFTGKGGRVDIIARGILGITPQPAPTSRSDITVSSVFGVAGEISTETLDLDPSQDLTSLPEIPQSTEVQQACQPSGSRQANRFVNVGRGGLPLNPTHMLSNHGIWEDVSGLTQPVASFAPEQTIQSRSDQSRSDQSRSNSSNQGEPLSDPGDEKIIEARTLTINEQGEVVLTAREAQSLTRLTCEI